MKLVFFAVTFAFLFLSNGWAGDAMTATASHGYKEYFDIDLEGDITVTAESPVEDFVLYKFSDHGMIILTAYLGNAPDQKIFKSKAAQFRAGVVQIASDSASGTLIRREWLIQLCASGWPQYLHLFTGKNAGKGDSLASSVRDKLSPTCAKSK